MYKLLLNASRQLTQTAGREPSAHILARCVSQRLLRHQWHWFSSGSSMQLTDGEKALIDKIKSKFPGAKHVEVSDVSGGCGAMYQISIEAEEFRGKKTVMQHRMVNEALEEDIKAMHGLQLNTKVPDES